MSKKEILLIQDSLKFLPKRGSKIKLLNLKWEKSQDLYISKLSSLLNVDNLPHNIFFFNIELYIMKSKDKLYYISTSNKDSSYFQDINPIFTLKEAKNIAQNVAMDMYDLEYGYSFKII